VGLGEQFGELVGFLPGNTQVTISTISWEPIPENLEQAFLNTLTSPQGMFPTKTRVSWEKLSPQNRMGVGLLGSTSAGAIGLYWKTPGAI
jgi:hypothetical protein